MTNRKASLILVLVVLTSLLVSGCDGVKEATAEQMAENVDRLSVENVAKWQQESRDAGVACEFVWISNDLSIKLAHWHICTPANEKDANKLAEKLHEAITECIEISVNAFAEGSEAREAARLQCLGPLGQ